MDKAHLKNCVRQKIQVVHVLELQIRSVPIYLKAMRKVRSVVIVCIQLKIYYSIMEFSMQESKYIMTLWLVILSYLSSLLHFRSIVLKQDKDSKASPMKSMKYYFHIKTNLLEFT
jgi:hypothetical protein